MDMDYQEYRVKASLVKDDHDLPVRARTVESNGTPPTFLDHSS